MEVQENRDKDNLFDEDLSDFINKAKDVAKDISLFSKNKGGTISKDTYLRIMALVEKEGCGKDGCEELKQDLI